MIMLELQHDPPRRLLPDPARRNRNGRGYGGLFVLVGGDLMCKHGEFELVKSGRQIVQVDRCISRLVKVLNEAGFQTVASCCGHGHRPGNIALADGREFVIARNWAEARQIGRLFPLDIHGNEVGT